MDVKDSDKLLCSHSEQQQQLVQIKPQIKNYWESLRRLTKDVEKDEVTGVRPRWILLQILAGPVVTRQHKER